MASNLVLLPYDYFGDPTRSRALSGGKIYIGEVDKDPETFPIDAFYIQEDGTEIPAPIGIPIGAGGYVVYNGKVVQVGCNENYSMRVRDKHGAQVYNVPNNFATGGATKEFVISNIWNLSGLTFENIEKAKLGETLDGTIYDLTSLPEFTKLSWQGYHAQSDGGSNWGRLRFGVHVEDGGSIFRINANTYIEANLKGQTVNIQKFGAMPDYDGGANPSPTENGAIINTALAYIDDNTAIKATGNGYWYNTQINLENKRLTGYAVFTKDSSLKNGIYMSGTKSVVEKITFQPVGASPDGYCDIKFAEASVRPNVLKCVFDDTKYVGTSYNAVIGSDFGIANCYTNRVIKPVIKGCDFIGYQRPLYLSSMHVPKVLSCDFELSTRDGIRTLHCSGHITISTCTFDRCGMNAPAGQTADGIDTNLSGESLTITGCKFLNCWVMGIDIKGYSNETGSDFKGKSSKIIITDNEIVGSGLSGVSAYSVDDLTGFTEWPYNYDLTISNNIITKTRYSATGNDSGAVWIRSGFKGVNIADNIITSNNTRGIYIQKDPDDPVDDARVKYVNITDNLIFNNYNYGAHLTDVKNLTISGNQFGQDESFSEDGEINTQGVGLKIVTTDAAAVGRTTIVKHNQFPNNVGSPYEVDSFDVIQAWSDNPWDGTTGVIASTLARVTSPAGTMFYGNGVTPSGTLGTYMDAVIVNNSPTIALGDYLFLKQLPDLTWAKTGELISV